MRLIFESETGRFEADVQRKGDTVRSTTGDITGEWHIISAEAPLVLFENDSGPCRAFVVRRKNEVFIHLNGRTRRLLDVSDEGERGDSSSGGDLRVVAPMPGTVIKLLKEAGATVVKGEPLVIVEAMKMENEVRAPGDVKIEQVLVKSGEKVGFGQELMRLIPASK